MDESPSPIDEQAKVILMPYDYITQDAGKQIRATLINAFNYWLNIPEKEVALINSVINQLHNASLLIDDIEDNSVLRRGIPVAHNIFGIPCTINCANYVYFRALDTVVKEMGMPGVTIYTEEMMRLHEGQGMDIHWRDTHSCPTEEQYIDMILKKTGGLFNLGIRMMQIFSNDKRDYSRIVSLMGCIFQINDDYMNLKSSVYADNKSFCEDLTEGKFSFPIIHSIRSRPDDKTLVSILRQRTKDLEIKKFAVDLMDKTRSFEYTMETLNRYQQEFRMEVESLGGNHLLMELLDTLLKNKD